MSPRLAATFAVVALALVSCSGADEPDPSGGSSSGGTQPPSVQVPSPPPGDAVSLTDTAWRTEVYRDVELEVPVTWKVGYAPVVDSTIEDSPMFCGVGAANALPDSRNPEPYVGRPGYGSDMCQLFKDGDLPVEGELVWFDSLVPVGSSDRGDLHVRTVEVGDQRVTVASFDRRLVDRIVESASVVDEDAYGCPESFAVERDHPTEGFGEPLSMSVCVYDAWPDPELLRTWSTRLGAGAGRKLLAALDDAEAATCRVGKDGRDQVVLLRVLTDDPFGKQPLIRDLTFTSGSCPAITPAVAFGPPGRGPFRLDKDVVEPWAVEGVHAYVSGGAVPRRLGDYFKPMMG